MYRYEYIYSRWTGSSSYKQRFFCGLWPKSMVEKKVSFVCNLSKNRKIVYEGKRRERPYPVENKIKKKMVFRQNGIIFPCSPNRYPMTSSSYRSSTTEAQSVVSSRLCIPPKRGAEAH